MSPKLCRELAVPEAAVERPPLVVLRFHVQVQALLVGRHEVALIARLVPDQIQVVSPRPPTLVSPEDQDKTIRSMYKQDEKRVEEGGHGLRNLRRTTLPGHKIGDVVIYLVTNVAWSQETACSP